MSSHTPEYFVETVLGPKRVSNLTLIEILDFYKDYINYYSNETSVQEKADELITLHLQ